MSKRNLMTICFKKTIATQIWRLKNGIGLVIKFGEHDVGCAVVSAGRRTVQAQISDDQDSGSETEGKHNE